MAEDAELAKLERKVQTLESQIADLLDRERAYRLGTDKNPMQGIYIADTQGSGVGILDYDAASDALRVKKVR